MELSNEIIEKLVKFLAFTGLYLFLFLASKLLKEFFTPYKINKEIIKNDNFAISLTLSGYYIAVVAVFIGSVIGPDKDLIKDLISIGGYAILGFVLLNLSRYINDKIILRKFSNVEELIEKKNVALGAVQFGSYIATGLIIASSITGESGNIVTALIFFALGQISFFAFIFIYDLITSYPIHEELEKQNIAVGVGVSGTLIAFGIIIANGIYGDFIGWKESIITMAIFNAIAFVFLPIVRVFVDKLLLPGHNLNKEILEDQNIGAGFLEATIAVSSAIVLVALI